MATPKELVKAFYESDFYKNEDTLKQYLHPECELYWSSSSGFVKFDYDEMIAHGKRLSQSFKYLRSDISHIIAENGFVSIRYTYYVVTFDDPDTEICLAHFISIWEVKDDKLFSCHQMSQMADELAMDSNAYLAIKVS